MEEDLPRLYPLNHALASRALNLGGGQVRFLEDTLLGQATIAPVQTPSEVRV